MRPDGNSEQAATNRWSDLDRWLPTTLDYFGEFGPELVLCLPFLNWLSKMGLLHNRRIGTYNGMKCFYDGLDCLEVIERPESRKYVPAEQRASWLPVKNEHSFDGLGRCPQHLYPDLRQKFSESPLIPEVGSTDRPILVVHNKYNNEWNEGPVNHISIDALRIIFRCLSKDFTIVYIRHGMSAPTHDFAADHNITLPFDDRQVLDDHPDVLCFDDLHTTHRAKGGTQDVNTFKNVLYSRCHHFISSQGGGAHQIALYSGALLVVLHRRGSEERWAYGEGYYKFMASVPPILAVCRSEDDLLRGIPLFLGTAVIKDRILLSSGNEKRLRELSP